jgi:hypothetical protein
MPGSTAERGDIYNVVVSVTLQSDKKATARRMVCVAEQPSDQLAWRAMARTTSAGDPAVDLFSPADSSTGLTLDGWWSYRFLRSVKKRWTGVAGQCDYLATLSDPMRTKVLDHYKNRPKPVAGV